MLGRQRLWSTRHSVDTEHVELVDSRLGTGIERRGRRARGRTTDGREAPRWKPAFLRDPLRDVTGMRLSPRRFFRTCRRAQHDRLASSAAAGESKARDAVLAEVDSL